MNSKIKKSDTTHLKNGGHTRGLSGFTLLEIIVSISLFAIIIILVSSIYVMSQRSYNQNSTQAELSQNARVAFDRLSRELRQSTGIVTALPATDSDIFNPPANQIFFQDGHDNSRLTYLKYYLDGTNLMREHSSYYFNTEPGVDVYYDSLDLGGNLPLKDQIENRVIGEYVSGMKFWGEDRIINFELSFLKNQKSFVLRSSVYSRNQ